MANQVIDTEHRPQGTHDAPRRRRWPWIVAGSVVGVIVVALAAVAWIVSGMIADGARIPQPQAGYPMTITSVTSSELGDQVAYSGVPSGWTDQGIYAVATADGGYALTAAPVVGTDGTGTRLVTRYAYGPALAVGQQAALDGWYFGPDPSAVLGLPYEDVVFDGPLGPHAAWLIPGESDTWVVYAHGRSDAPAQGLRLAQSVVAQGHPMLLITYRNDEGAPAGSGYGQFGVDEWPDIEGAVQYALDNGAANVVLAGTSMGAAAELAFLENSPLADRVIGAVFDAPALDYGSTVSATAGEMGVPGVIVGLGKAVARWRFGFDWSAMDYVARAASFATPMLVLQGTADTSARLEQAEQFAAAAPPGTVRLELFDEAGHTLAWNMDPARYGALVEQFLASLAPAS